MTKRLNEFLEFVNDTLLNDSETEEYNVRDWLMSKFEEKKKTFEIYQEIVERDKELHTIRLDIHEMTCNILQCMDGEAAMPHPPVYIDLPKVDIQCPTLPKFLQEDSESNSDSEISVHQKISNNIFRSIMHRKSVSIAQGHLGLVNSGFMLDEFDIDRFGESSEEDVVGVDPKYGSIPRIRVHFEDDSDWENIEMDTYM